MDSRGVARWAAIALALGALATGCVTVAEFRKLERGNPWYDENVVRAIQKASPLPAPPEAGEWAFVFVPEDSY